MESRVPTAAARNEGVTGPFALPERAWASRPPDRASNVLLPLSAHRAGEIVTLLSPQIIDQSGDQDEQHEGCLSFFDVRSKLPWPLRIQVEHDSFQSNYSHTPRMRGQVVKCNVSKRGWINGVGGCPNVGGICISCTMPGFPEKCMPFMESMPITWRSAPSPFSRFPDGGDRERDLWLSRPVTPRDTPPPPTALLWLASKGR